MSITLSLKPLIEWGINIKEPLIISGPCSAETEEQVLQTCQRLAKSKKVNMLRAGIWKPRTRPNSFEGIGSVGLQWIKQAGEATGLPVAVEVANVKHVYEALRMGIDVLWIGARTSVNPFAVQEIADALKGVDIPVLVKNPVNPDLALWIGALERLNQAGITKLGAIHRGFSTHASTRYRNRPQWEIPLELKRQVPELPLVCDPSHICGRRDILAEVAQKAMDLDFDGLMIESHINPDRALSDAKQQVVPEKCHDILNGIIYRHPDAEDAILIHNLEDLREAIDEIDSELIEVLKRRMLVSEKIGEYKRDNEITIFQAERWNEIIDRRAKNGEANGLTYQFMIDLYNAIHIESRRQQTSIMNNTRPAATITNSATPNKKD